MKLSQKLKNINKSCLGLHEEQRKKEAVRATGPRWRGQWRLEQVEVGIDVPSRWDQQGFLTHWIQEENEERYPWAYSPCTPRN